MKRSIIILTMAAAVLASLASCQREYQPQEKGDDSAQEVVTSFVFNVSTSASRTKQTAGDTQAEGSNFRGIVDTKLMAFYTLGDARDGSILTVDVNADKVYDLAKFADESRISSSQSRRILEMSLPLKTNIMVLYGRAGIPSNVSIGSGFTMQDKFGALAADNGYNVSSEAGKTDFALRKRLEDSDRYYTTEKVLAGILTVIMNTGLVDTDGTPGADEALLATNKEGTENAYGFDLPANSYPAVKWSDYSTATVSPVECGSPEVPAHGNPGDDDYTPAVPAVPSHELYPLEEQLQYVYKQMTTIKSEQGELRSAAGEDILRIIKDLWSNVNAIRCAAPISEAEAVAKHLAQHIHEHLQDYFNTSSIPSDGSGVSDCSFKSLTGASSSGLINKLDQDPYWPAGCGENKPALLNMQSLEGVSLDGFPFNFNMPRGVSYMAFDSATSCFYYPQYFNTSAVTGDPTDQSQTAPSTGVSYDASSYFYPAEILYFGNSPVRASDNEHKTADYPGSTETGSWQDESKWATDDWSDSHVVSSTRSVAMKYSVNYGVAMLETKVGYRSGLTSLKDNNHAIQALNAGFVDTVDPDNPDNNKTAVEKYDAAGHALDEPDKTIPLTEDSFKLTGVIIGGQPVHVGWNFLPQKENSTDPIIKTGFIYDKAIANQTIPTPSGGENYTVVFDNYNAKAHSENKDQDKVFVALEFQNNTGTDFYGNCNLIRDGGYFYLIACLDPTAVTEDANKIQWPSRTYDSSDPTKLTREISHIVPPYSSTGESLEISRVFVQDFVTRATFNFGENSLKYAYLTVPDLRSSSVTIGLSVDIQWGDGLVYEDVILGGE